MGRVAVEAVPAHAARGRGFEIGQAQHVQRRLGRCVAAAVISREIIGVFEAQAGGAAAIDMLGEH